jgi:hypothetical protein
VLLGRNRARPRCTVRGAACSYAGHGPRVQCWRGPRPRGGDPPPRGARPARPRPVQRERTSGARRIAAQRAAALLGKPTAAQCWRTGDGGERRLTGAETAARRGGRAARQRSGQHGFGPRRSGRVLSGRRLGQDGGARGEAAVGEGARAARRRSGGRGVRGTVPTAL